MKNREDGRRSFLKKSAVAGGGLLLAQSGLATIGSDALGESKVQKTSGPVNETVNTINRLRSIHGNFTEKDIPEETIQTILQSSVRAANASNMQSYSIVVVKDRNTMNELCGYKGSCLLLYCVDFNRLKDCAGSLGHPYFPDSIVQFVTAGINTALAAQTAAIAARSLGVDSLFTNGIHRGDMERVWKLVDLPKEHCFPLIALVLGYPTEEPAHKVGRLTGAGVIHYGKYQRLSKADLDNLTRQYDDKTLQLGLNENWESEGHKHYLDWLFKSWLRSAKPTDRETQMFSLLKRSGFVEAQKG